MKEKFTWKGKDRKDRGRGGGVRESKEKGKMNLSSGGSLSQMAAIHGLCQAKIRRQKLQSDLPPEWQG